MFRFFKSFSLRFQRTFILIFLTNWCYCVVCRGIFIISRSRCSIFDITIIWFFIWVSHRTFFCWQLKTVLFVVQSFLDKTSILFRLVKFKICISSTFWTKRSLWFHLVHWYWCSCYIIFPRSNTWILFLFRWWFMPRHSFWPTVCESTLHFIRTRTNIIVYESFIRF